MGYGQNDGNTATSKLSHGLFGIKERTGAEDSALSHGHFYDLNWFECTAEL